MKADHERLEKTIQEMSARDKLGQTAAARPETVTVDSESSIQRMKALQSEVTVLQSSIRFLSTTSKDRRLSEYADLLSEPFVPSHSPLSALAAVS